MNENDYIDIILDIILHIAVTNMTAAAGSACTFTKSVQNKVQVVAEACQEQGLGFFPIAMDTHQVAVELELGDPNRFWLVYIKMLP